MARSPLMSFLHAAASDGVPDAELLRRYAASADEAAFELLVRRHAELVWAVCRATAGSHHAAEDAFQAAFLALARKPAIRENVPGWLHRVARHAALRAKKASRGRQPPDPVSPGGPPDEYRSVHRGSEDQGADAPRSPDPELAALLHAELDRLPDKYRLPVLLCDLDGLTHAAAADRLGWPVGSVSGRLVRARELLKSRLLRKGVAPAAVLLSAGPASASVIRATTSAAVGGASPAVTGLAEGVLSAMRFSKLKLLAAGVTVAVGLTGGGALLVGAASQPPAADKPADPKPVARKPMADAKQRAVTIERLKMLMIGLHSYHDVYGQLPEDVYSKDGKPLLSWRVQLLPYLEQVALYKLFKQDEPWDSPGNKQAASVVVKAFSNDREPGGQEYPVTFFQRPAGKGLGHEPGRKLRFADFTDGLSNTIAVVEAETPVPWAKPEDLKYDPSKPADVFGPFLNVTHLALWDGSVTTTIGGIPKASGNYFTRADGFVPDFDALRKGTGLPPGVSVPAEDLAALRKELADGTAELDRLLAENRKLQMDHLEAERRAKDASGVGLAEVLLELDRLLGDARRENERLKQAGKK